MATELLRDSLGYFTALDLERYRAVILHAAPEQGRAVTQFAQKLCTRLGGEYLDLLDLFIKTKELKEHIDSFSPEKLRELLIEECRNSSLLFVDRADFLLDTWRRGERQDFYRMLGNQWDGYKEGMSTKLVICLQTSQELEDLKVVDSHGESRNFRLSDFTEIV